MYSNLPAGQRMFVRGTVAASWIAGAGAGTVAVASTSTKWINELGVAGTLLVATLLLVSCGTAFLGVVLNRYRLEWVASWAGAAALMPYVVILWAATAVEWTRGDYAFLVTALLLFMMSRAAQCSAHAAKLREVHVATVVLDALDTEGGGRDERGAIGSGD